MVHDDGGRQERGRDCRMEMEEGVGWMRGVESGRSRGLVRRKSLYKVGGGIRQKME